MFEVFIENFCKEKQAAWLEGCVEVYMAQYAKKAENDYPKEAVMRIAKATFTSLDKGTQPFVVCDG